MSTKTRRPPVASRPHAGPQPHPNTARRRSLAPGRTTPRPPTPRPSGAQRPPTPRPSNAQRPITSSVISERTSRPASQRTRTGPGSRTRVVPRIRLLRLVIVLVLLVVAGRLVQIQIFQSTNYQRDARGQLVHSVTVPSLRGGIFDRNGSALAVSMPSEMVIADDFQVTHPMAEARQLAPMLGISASTLAQELHQRSGYVPLVRHLAESRARTVAAESLPGITMVENPYRVWPDGNLASPVLGGTNASGAGTGGVEYRYQRLLSGKPRRVELLISPGGTVLPQPASSSSSRSAAGQGLELTLDQSLQYETEQALSSAISSTHALNGTAVIMDVKTGQVLSSASLVADSSGGVAQAPQDLAVAQTYEPGSVFKLVTFSAALQDGVINPDTVFSVPGTLTLDGSTFHDAEAHGTEELTATQILSQSSNIGTSEIAQQLGESKLLSQVHDLGFGQRTALNFPGESSGIVVSPSQWEPTDYVDLPIGQVDAVTAQQVLDMMNAVANGGVLVQPELVQATVSPSGKVNPTPSSNRSRVMSPATAGELTGMLEQVVSQGTGTSAAIPGYTVAGKTGTASIPDPVHGGYLPNGYMASFVGFAPAEHPVFAAIVVLDQPTPIFGGTVAAPVFSQIVGYALHHYSIPTSPGAPTTTPPPSSSPQTQDIT